MKLVKDEQGGSDRWRWARLWWRGRQGPRDGWDVIGEALMGIAFCLLTVLPVLGVLSDAFGDSWPLLFLGLR